MSDTTRSLMGRLAMAPLAAAVLGLFVGYLFLGWSRSSYPGWFLVLLVGAIAFAIIGRRVRKEVP